MDYILRLSIQILDPIFQFWNWNMDFHTFGHKWELLVIAAYNRYQINLCTIIRAWARYLDYEFGLLIIDADSGSGFRTRNIYFLSILP